MKISYKEYKKLWSIFQNNDISVKEEYNKYVISFKYKNDSENELFTYKYEIEDYIKNCYKEEEYFDLIEENENNYFVYIWNSVYKEWEYLDKNMEIRDGLCDTCLWQEDLKTIKTIVNKYCKQNDYEYKIEKVEY